MKLSRDSEYALYLICRDNEVNFLNLHNHFCSDAQHLSYILNPLSSYNLIESRGYSLFVTIKGRWINFRVNKRIHEAK